DYIFQVLDPSLRNEKIFKGEALTFGDLHGRPLYTPGPKPFKRILSTHAQVSIKDAVALNWMSAVDAQRYDIYHNLSRGSWDDATSIQQVSGSKYKANDLTRQYKIVPYSGLRNPAYEKELNAGHTNRAAVLRPPPGMKIQHLPKGIREYVSRNPTDFKDYLDEIS
ncbi:hypothetical protein PROFUN_16932, partial [Planoprotostelium fungivorum]